MPRLRVDVQMVQMQRCDVLCPRLLFASVSSCSLQCGAVCCYSRCTMQAMQRLIRSMSAVADAGLKQFALIWRGRFCQSSAAASLPGRLSAERPARSRSKDNAGPIGALYVCEDTAEFVRVRQDGGDHALALGVMRAPGHPRTRNNFVSTCALDTLLPWAPARRAGELCGR